MDGPGIARVRRGKGFSYTDPDGKPLSDEATLARIKELVIPPAWKKVWISPHRNGHIQAIGTDVAGRRQYMYHQRWQQERAEEKFDRVLEMSRQLPEWRERVAEDLAGKGLSRDRVLALALHLLDRGYFRAGGEQYAEENESYGLATLLCEHVTLQSGFGRLRLPRQERGAAYPADRGSQVVTAVRSLMRRGDRSDTTPGVPQRIRLGRHSRRRPQRPLQGVGRGRLQREGPADLAWHGAGRGGVRRRRSARVEAGDEEGRGRGDARGVRGAGQHPGGGAWVIRGSARGGRLRAGHDDRRGRPPGQSYAQARRGAGAPREGDEDA